MQQQNHRLRYTLDSQRTTISRFEHLILDRISQVAHHFQKEAQEGLQLVRENEFLKRVVMIATNNPETQSPPGKGATASKGKDKQPPPPPQLANGEGGWSENAFLRSMARTAE
jgi:hypothetical protein